MNIFEQLTLWAKFNRITATLIALSIIVALFSKLGSDFEFLHFLFISEYRQGLPEILHGQLWRLFTPIIIHFGIMHILFNMLWLYQLGSTIEQRQNRKRMMILVIVISILSNLANFSGVDQILAACLGLFMVYLAMFGLKVNLILEQV